MSQKPVYNDDFSEIGDTVSHIKQGNHYITTLSGPITISTHDLSNGDSFRITDPLSQLTANPITLDLGGSVSYVDANGSQTQAMPFILDVDNIDVTFVKDGADWLLVNQEFGSPGGSVTGVAKDIEIAAGNMLRLLDETGTAMGTPVDLSLYIDDSNLSRLVSGVLGASGIVTFERDDGTTFTLNLAALLPDMFGEPIQAAAALTTTNGVSVNAGDWYLKFPNNKTYKEPAAAAGASGSIIQYVGPAPFTATTGITVNPGDWYHTYPDGTSSPAVGADFDWAISTMKVDECIEGPTRNTPITQFTNTFTPDSDGYYVLTHKASAVQGSGLVYIGTSAGDNDVFTSTANRIDSANKEKHYAVELEAGIEYFISTQAGGGSIQFDVCFELAAASVEGRSKPLTTPIHEFFKESWLPSTFVDVSPHVDQHGYGVKLQDINGNNSFMDGVPFTVPGDNYRVRFEVRKEDANALYVDLRRVSNNALQRLVVNLVNGNVSIQSGTVSTQDMGHSWLIDAIFNTDAGEDYKIVLFPDLGGGQNDNVFYSWETFADDSDDGSSDITKQLRTLTRVNKAPIPVDVEDFDGIPLSRICDDTTSSWSVYRSESQIPQRGQPQYVRILWRLDPTATHHACLRAGLSGVVIDTLFDVATGDIVEKNGGQTELVKNVTLSNGLQETIVLFNTTRTDLFFWDLFPGYGPNNSNNASNGTLGHWDIAELDFDYPYQVEEAFVSRHKIVADADNTGGQAAGNDLFIIDTPITEETSPIITDNGDGTYQIVTGVYPVRIEANFVTTSLSGQATSRAYFIRDTASGASDRMPRSIDGIFGQTAAQSPALALIEPNTTITVDVRSVSSSGNQVMTKGSCLTFTEVFTVALESEGKTDLYKQMAQWNALNNAAPVQEAIVYNQHAVLLEDTTGDAAYYSLTGAQIFEGNSVLADRTYRAKFARNLPDITTTAAFRFFGANNADLIVDPIAGTATPEANVELIRTSVTDSYIEVVFKCRNANYTALRLHHVWGNTGALPNVNSLTGKQYLLEWSPDHAEAPAPAAPVQNVTDLGDGTRIMRGFHTSTSNGVETLTLPAAFANTDWQLSTLAMSNQSNYVVELDLGNKAPGSTQVSGYTATGGQATSGEWNFSWIAIGETP